MKIVILSIFFTTSCVCTHNRPSGEINAPPKNEQTPLKKTIQADGKQNTSEESATQPATGRLQNLEKIFAYCEKSIFPIWKKLEEC